MAKTIGFNHITVESFIAAYNWNNTTGQISTMPIHNPEYAFDFSDSKASTITSLEELQNYCADECVNRVVIVNVTISSEDSIAQYFTWNVATALDYNMLEAAISAAVNLADGEGSKVTYSFEVK